MAKNTGETTYGLYLTKVRMKQPKVENELFSPGEDWRSNSCVNWDYRGWGLYAMGYREAADILANNLNTCNLDTLIYPVSFLYRQAIELQLKEIISTGRQLSEFHSDEVPNTHNLVHLWGMCKKYCEYLWPDDMTGITEFEKTIEQINEFDKNAPLCHR